MIKFVALKGIRGIHEDEGCHIDHRKSSLIQAIEMKIVQNQARSTQHKALSTQWQMNFEI